MRSDNGGRACAYIKRRAQARSLAVIDRRSHSTRAMKIGTLRAIAHNVVDSMGSGCGLLIGIYDMNVYGEAKRSPGGVIAIDFLGAKVTQGKASRTLASAIVKYQKVLPTLCAKHGASVDDFKSFTARFSGDVLSRRVVVTVRDRLGRCYVDEYVGIPARRVKVTDHLGRIRTKRGGVRRVLAVSATFDR